MHTYHFNVFNSDRSLAATQSFEISNSQAVWNRVVDLAWRVGESGGQIRVTDQAGELVVLTGVNSARRAMASVPDRSRDTGKYSRAA